MLLSKLDYAILLLLRLAVIHSVFIGLWGNTIGVKVLFTSQVLKFKGKVRQCSQPSVAGSIQLCRGKHVREGITVCDYSKMASIEIIMKLFSHTPFE